MAPNEQHASFPSFVEALLLVVVLFGLELVAGSVLHDVGGLFGYTLSGLGGLSTFFGNARLFTALMHYKRLSYAALFHAAPASAPQTIRMLVLPVCLLLPGAVMAAMALDAFLVWLVPMSEAEIDMFQQMMSGDVISVVGVCLLAPVLEEMLCRGIILRSFLQQYSPRRAIVLSAVVFGLAHLNLYQFASASLMGLLLGWLYARTRSLLPCILLHAAYNGTLTVMQLSETGLNAGKDAPSLTVWIGAALAAYAGWQLLVRAVNGITAPRA